MFAHQMRDGWHDSSPKEKFQGNVLVNTLLKKYPGRFQSRWAAVKFARGLFRDGIINSVANLKSFEDSGQLYTWPNNDSSAEWRKMTSHEVHSNFRGYTPKKKNFNDQEDIDIIKSVKSALSGAKQDTSLISKFFKDLQKDFPDSNSSQKTQPSERNWINPRLSTASSESSADTITHSYLKFKDKPGNKVNNNHMYQMGSNTRNYSSIPEEDMPVLDRSHGGSSLEYELSAGNPANSRRWQDAQFCYSDNEKQLIEEMKKMKRDHNESIQAYEERISKLMAKMHELKGIAEMLENSSTKGSPYGLLPGRAHLINILGNKQDKKPLGSTTGGFVPPPLPPRPTKGNKVYPNKPIIHPKCKMKHLDWSRIILKDGSHNSLTTLWHNMAEPKIDTDELERLFRCFSGVGNSLYDDIVNRRGKSKHQYVTILTGEQSRRLVSTMKILPCELPTVVDGLTAMDYQTVQSDRFVELVEILATCNEIDTIMYHVKRKGSANIDHPEFFISEISKLDHLKDRLDFMRFKKKVQWHLFEIDQQLRELHTACDEISNSLALKNLMETLLAVGNYVNGGTEEGQADGFTIETMNKLKEIQDQDNKTNLLEFVLKMYCQLYETEVDVSCPTRFRLPEPSNMRHAAQVSFESIQETLQNLHGELKIHKEKVAEQFSQNGNNENTFQIKSTIDNFHTSAIEMLTEEERLLHDTKDVYQKTSTYFLYGEAPNKPQNFFQIWAIFLHDCKYYWKLAHRRIAKERFELEFKYKGQTSMGASHGFDNYRANMLRHLTTLRNTQDPKDGSLHVKHLNNWMGTNEVPLKQEKSGSLYSSHQMDNKQKYTPQRSTSPKPLTSDPPDSASVHKPQPMKNGSTPPHYENQNDFEKVVYGSKHEIQSDERSGNSDKTDKSQFSFKSWLKREPGKRHNSGESKSSGEDKRLEQTIESGKRTSGETTLSKIKHSVVQKFTSSTTTSKQRHQQSVPNTYVTTTEKAYQSPPSYVPLSLNVNDIDPYETSLGRESRYGTMSSEIDLRPNAFDKGNLNDSDLQVNSAERRSKFDASKFTYKGVKTRQGSDISTEYASLYHTPPFSSPPVTHIDKDGYASPIILNSTSKSDINNNDTKLRGQGRDPRNRAPLALGSNISISDAYKRSDTEHTDAKKLHLEKKDKCSNDSAVYPHSSHVARSGHYPSETPTSRSYNPLEHSETNVKSAYPYSDSRANENSHQLSSVKKPWEIARDPPAKPERVLERYPGSQNLSINPDSAHREVRTHQHFGMSNDQIPHNNDNRKYVSRTAINRAPITSLIKRFEKDNEQDLNKEPNEQPTKQIMLSTSTPITPRRPMTLHENDDDPPPLPPRYDFHSSSNKQGFETNSHQQFTPQFTETAKLQRTPLKPIHTRESTGTSEQEEGYKDKLRRAATSAVFERYKSQGTPPKRQGGESQTPQYGRQSSNQSQFSHQSSLNQAANTPSIRQNLPFGRHDDAAFSNPSSLSYTPQQQTPQSQSRKAGLGRFANISTHQASNSDNRSSIHL
ncbi:uncharacterized protein LOC143080114 isoform X2 [Mytilus galloprovincialis]|uniref:uncharacterized protein LOC143080114 isoform X2 n=1 Tax=Mytilus galloprovincialis TaxID=29158 RepID=UPI003F7BEC6C